MIKPYYSNLTMTLVETDHYSFIILVIQIPKNNFFFCDFCVILIYIYIYIY